MRAEAKILSPDLVLLTLPRPAHNKVTGARFRYKAGQYVFLNISSISKLEWHPFTLASSPHDPALKLLIRALPGHDWSTRLHEARRMPCPSFAHQALNDMDTLHMLLIMSGLHSHFCRSQRRHCGRYGWTEQRTTRRLSRLRRTAR